MKTKIKYLFATLAIIGLLAFSAAPVNAETGSAGFNITNVVFATSATYTCGNGVADLSEHDFTTLSYKFTLTSTNGTTNTLYFARVDSSGNVDTGPQFTWINAVTTAQSGGSGSVTNTNTWTYFTNYDRSTIGAFTGFKLMSNVVVTLSGYVTNPVLNAELKTVKK